eukprot:133712_1
MQPTARAHGVQYSELQIESSSKPWDKKLLCIVLLVLLLLCAGVVIVVLASALSSYSFAADKSLSRTSGDPRFGNLIFDEEFNEFNLSRWQHEITLSGGGNWEFEYYTNNRSNSYVKDGVLYIKPTLTNNTFTSPGFMTSGTIDLWGGAPADQCTSNAFWGCFRTGTASNVLNSVQSARIRTVNSFAFNYGRVEVRAQLPRGDWLWPAIWMLPKQEAYGNWPASGEIDIVEARGNDKLTSGGKNGNDIGSNIAGTTVHWGPYFGADRFPMTTKTYALPQGELFSASFHNWTLDWTPDGFNCSVDGHMYFSVTTGDGYWSKGKFDTSNPNSNNPWTYGGKDAPFDREFYFVLNLAAGGVTGFFPDGSVSSPTDFPSYPQPWGAGGNAYQSFWEAVDEWYPTWYPNKDNGEGAAMKVDYIRVYEYIGN